MLKSDPCASDCLNDHTGSIFQHWPSFSLFHWSMSHSSEVYLSDTSSHFWYTVSSADGSSCCICSAYLTGIFYLCLPQCPKNYIPVCGSNGDTYQNECYLRQAACTQQRPISLATEGPCYPGESPTLPETKPNIICLRSHFSDCAGFIQSHKHSRKMLQQTMTVYENVLFKFTDKV